MHLLKSWIYESSSSSSSLDGGVSRCKRPPFKVLRKVWRLKISHLCTCKLDHASVVDVEMNVAFWVFLWRITQNVATILGQSPVLNTSPRSVHHVELAWIIKLLFLYTSLHAGTNHKESRSSGNIHKSLWGDVRLGTSLPDGENCRKSSKIAVNNFIFSNIKLLHFKQVSLVAPPFHQVVLLTLIVGLYIAVCAVGYM